MGKLEELHATVSDESQVVTDCPPAEDLARLTEHFAPLYDAHDPELAANVRAEAERIRNGKMSPYAMQQHFDTIREQLIPALGDLIIRCAENLDGPPQMAGNGSIPRPTGELPPHILKALSERSEGSTVETSVSFPNRSDHLVVIPQNCSDPDASIT